MGARKVAPEGLPVQHIGMSFDTQTQSAQSHSDLLACIRQQTHRSPTTSRSRAAVCNTKCNSIVSRLGAICRNCVHATMKRPNLSRNLITLTQLGQRCTLSAMVTGGVGSVTLSTSELSTTLPPQSNPTTINAWLVSVQSLPQKHPSSNE